MRYVIAGAGSAGCVLANRLSANPDVEVILIEAGPDYFGAPLPPDIRNGGRNSFDAHDWGYRHQAGQLTLRMPRGKVVGGSSAVNTCIALRGQPLDYDEWELPDWTWAKCLPAFRRLENDLDYGETEIHGGRGPLTVRRHRADELTPWQAAFVEGCVQLGYPECDDTNAPGTHGVGPHAMNKVDGVRINAAMAYLPADVRARPNLTILPYTLVRTIRFDGVRAIGLEVERGGVVEAIDGDRVVLTCGAIATPGLLQRSGVGAPRDLRRLGVDVRVANEAVGCRVLDHCGVGMFLRPRLFAGTHRFDPVIQTTCRFSSGLFGFDNDVIVQAGSTMPTPWGNPPLVSLIFSVGKTQGRGTIRWDSVDPRAQPVIDSRILEHPTDMRVALDTYDRLVEIADTPACRKVAHHFWPGRRITADRRKLRARLAFMCDSGYHPSGTVPMGAAPGEEVACDPHGNVFGAENLVVADASLLPTMPTANIHLTVLMMAERIAEWV